MLNGDICVANYLTRSKESPKAFLGDIIRDFFAKAADAYSYVVYIPGNHEHYHGVYVETVDILKNALAQYPNIFILQNDFVRIGKYKIIGSTLWTDCDKGNPLVLNYLQGYLNDFKIVDYSKKPWKRFWPIDSMVEHNGSIKYIDFQAAGEDNVIVMSHHAPSFQSIHRSYHDPMYYYANRGYYSDLDQFIIDRPQIKLWTHGHVHNNFDYMIGDTKIVCNPHGYRTENIHDFNRGNIIELP
jgi:Icc-related predicted phosphoesterase